MALINGNLEGISPLTIQVSDAIDVTNGTFPLTPPFPYLKRSRRKSDARESVLSRKVSNASPNLNCISKGGEGKVDLPKNLICVEAEDKGKRTGREILGSNGREWNAKNKPSKHASTIETLKRALSIKGKNGSADLKVVDASSLLIENAAELPLNLEKVRDAHLSVPRNVTVKPTSVAYTLEVLAGSSRSSSVQKERSLDTLVEPKNGISPKFLVNATNAVSLPKIGDTKETAKVEKRDDVNGPLKQGKGKDAHSNTPTYSKIPRESPPIAGDQLHSADTSVPVRNMFSVSAAPTSLGFKPIRKGVEEVNDFEDRNGAFCGDDRTSKISRPRASSLSEPSKFDSLQMSGNQWNELLANYRKHHVEGSNKKKVALTRAQSSSLSTNPDQDAFETLKLLKMASDDTFTSVSKEPSAGKYLVPLVRETSDNSVLNDSNANAVSNATAVSTLVPGKSIAREKEAIFPVSNLASVFPSHFSIPKLQSRPNIGDDLHDAFKQKTQEAAKVFANLFIPPRPQNVFSFQPHTAGKLNQVLHTKLEQCKVPQLDLGFPDCTTWTKHEVEHYAKKLFTQNEYLLKQLMEVVKQRDVLTNAVR